MIRILLALLILLTPGTVMAQSVPVSTGEHGAFTRIALELPPGTNWRLEQSGRSAELVLLNSRVLFNMSGAFRRIDRKRIADLKQDGPGGALQIALACECEVVATQEGRRLVILDIKAGRVERVSSASDLTPPLPSLQTTYRFSLPGLEPVPSSESAGPSTEMMAKEPAKKPEPPGAEMKKPEEPPEPEMAENGDSPVRSIPDMSIRLPDDNALLLDARQYQDLSRFQDLLQTRLSRSQDLNLTDVGESVLAMGAPPSDPAGSEQLDERSPGINVETSIDEGLRQISASLKGRETKAKRCSRALDFFSEGWGEKDDAYREIGRLRLELVTEFDDVKPEVAIQIAKTYLLMGFGAEAKYALALMAERGEDEMLLGHVANLVDGEPAPSQGFVELLHCGDVFHFWAAMAGAGFGGDVETEAVLRSFARLPVELREFLGPKLTRLLLDSGLQEEASAVMRATSRISENANPELTMADAKVADSKGDAKTAKDRLEDVVETGSAQSPEALITLVEKNLKEKSGVEPATVDLIEAYAEELEGSEIEPELLWALAAGRALSGAFDKAVAVLEDLEGKDEETARNTRAMLITLLNQTASDFDFARYGALFVNEDAEGINREELRQMTERFLALGLATSAQRGASVLLGEAPDANDRILQARIDLARKLPHQAMISLLGLDGENVDALRAEAMTQMNDFEAAAGLYDRLGESEDASRSRWLSGNPEIIEAIDPDQEGQIPQLATAARELGELASNRGEPGSLNDARELLSASEETRRLLDTLLPQ